MDAHHARLHPTCYIKAEGEVDIAYVERGRFWPIEVKWSGRIRSADIKQAKKYPNSLIVSRDPSPEVHGIRNELLPLHLLRLGPSPHVAPDT